MLKLTVGGGDSYAVGEEASLPLSPAKTLEAQKIFGGKKMANCETCKKVQNAPESVPYVVHESSMARMERQVRRLLIALIVAIVLLFASSAIFTYAWLQYDYSSEDIVTVDGKDGIANYIGNDGDIVNGESYGSETE